ncbi:MAG TPA: peptide-N4-asparagine amidase [Pseudoxanthomonas sp.]|nr:peptide-N4-asparagine amidase [Pseudoxanthomonas sp.]
MPSRFLKFPIAAALLLLPAFAFATKTPIPDKFGNDHDDPRTAHPSPVPEGMPACTVDVLRHGFDSFEPAKARIDAAKRCPGPWHKVVLRLDGAVKGRQYDRIGQFSVGGVTIFRTSSPEPSREGIEWRVEKDVSAYAPLFAQPQDAEMFLGNVVNETYTGVFEVKLSLLFFRADEEHPAAQAADAVLPLDGLHEDGADTVGRIAIPADSERLLAEVYATGSGGGCEEFWYYAVPLDGYWCHNPQGPYREVQVLLDGRIAGIAAPYPHIYTGGWSNPLLWYAIPAPRTFDIQPILYDLTPFIGMLNDGKPHEVRLHVAGVPEGREGWKLLPNLQVWRDAGVRRTKARLLDYDAGEASHDLRLDAAVADDQSLHFLGARRFRARGEVRGSRGKVETTVERTLQADVHHRWGSMDDNDDRMVADWRDRAVVSRKSKAGVESQAVEQNFGFDGGIGQVPLQGGSAGKPGEKGDATEKTDPKVRLTTDIRIHDDVETVLSRDGETQSTRRTRDRFIGNASYDRGVPREKRRAVADTRQSYRIEEDGRCWQRDIATRNGRFVRDATDCGKAAPASQSTPDR